MFIKGFDKQIASRALLIKSNDVIDARRWIRDEQNRLKKEAELIQYDTTFLLHSYMRRN